MMCLSIIIFNPKVHAAMETDAKQHFNQQSRRANYVICLIITLFMVSPLKIYCQPNYQIIAQDSTASLDQISQDFYMWYSQQSGSDTIIAKRKLKNYQRFESFWAPRVGYSSTDTGSFNMYCQAVAAAMLPHPCLSTDESHWQPIGPFPNGIQNMGIIQAIWVDPQDHNIILVGSGRRGGILRTSNGGQSWQDVLIANKLPVFGITTITESPNTTGSNRVLYAGTGSCDFSFSVGLLKSVDNGLTWSIMEDFPTYASRNYSSKVEQVIVPKNSNPQDPDIIYVITSEAFYRSLDGGATWTGVSPSIEPLIDLDVNPENPLDLVVASNSVRDAQNVIIESSEVWRSEDGGMNWVKIVDASTFSAITSTTLACAAVDYPGADRFYVEVADACTTRVVAYFDLEEQSWVELQDNYNFVGTTKMNQFNYNSFEISSDYTRVYVGAELPSINATAINGWQWTGATSISHLDIRDIYLANTDQQGDDTIYFATDGGISASYDGGTSWISLNGNGQSGINNSELAFRIGINDLDPGDIIIGCWDNGINDLDNHSWTQNWHNCTWDPIINPGCLGGTADGGTSTFHPTNPDIVYFMDNGCLYKQSKNDRNNVLIDYIQNEPAVGYQSRGYYRPFTIDRKNPNKIITSANEPRVSITYDDGSSWISSILDVDEFNITAIEIAPSDSNIVYVATSKMTFDGTPAKAIYKSYNGGRTFTDITGSSLSYWVRNQYASITDIEVSRVNPDVIWVSMGGVWADPWDPYTGVVRVFRCLNTSAIGNIPWEDISYTGLSALPVNALAFHEAGNRLYVATDAGVYYLGQDNIWHCFSEDLPVIPSSDLQISRQTNELFLATYGYGLWKTKLPCLESTQSILIEVDETWSSDQYIGGDIWVESGKTLTLSNGASLYMVENGKIVVKVGARLIIDNATITSGCDEYWSHIEVWGTPNQPQTIDAQTGKYPYQGQVIIRNGGTIRNSVDGILAVKVDNNGNFDFSKTGGVINATDARFVNNNNSIWLGLYEWKVNGRPVPNKSNVTNCHFEWNRGMLPGHTGYSFIGLWDVDRVPIRGNSFINNTDNNVEDRGIGIVSFDASFTVDQLCNSISIPCTNVDKNIFQGLHYGVKLSNTDPSLVNYIKNSEFVSCYRGVLMIGTRSAVVTNNEFDMSSCNTWNQPLYGIYIDGGTGFKVEENTIIGGSPPDYKFGIIVNNTGPFDNQIYNNELSQLQYGINAQRQNKYGISNGLKLLCNRFDNPDLNDIVVTGQSITGGFNTGMAYHQVVSTGMQNPYQYPMGNQFTESHNAGSLDFDNSDAQHLVYYHSPDDPPIRYLPEYRSNISLFMLTSPHPCLSSATGIEELSTLYSKHTNAQVALNSAYLILSIWKNGGNLNLGEEVATIDPWEAYLMFNELLAMSPYISPEVMIATIENPVFSSLMIKLLMIANPQCIRAAEVMEVLYNRNPPLPQEYIDEILMEESTISQLDLLEGNVSGDLFLLNMIGEEIKRSYRSDTINEWASDSLLAFMSREPGLANAYELVGQFLAMGLVDNAFLELENIPLRYNLTGLYAEDHSAFVALFGIMQSFNSCQPAIDTLTLLQIESLIQLMNSDRPVISQLATGLLFRNYPWFEYEEEILTPPANTQRVAGQAPSVKTENAEYCLLKPNPATGYVEVSYKVERSNCDDLRLTLYDARGRAILERNLERRKDDLMIDISTFASGSYSVVLRCKGKVIVQQKLQIIN
jgi:hypothetical protein